MIRQSINNETFPSIDAFMEAFMPVIEDRTLYSEDEYESGSDAGSESD